MNQPNPCRVLCPLLAVLMSLPAWRSQATDPLSKDELLANIQQMTADQAAQVNPGDAEAAAEAFWRGDGDNGWPKAWHDKLCEGPNRTAGYRASIRKAIRKKRDERSLKRDGLVVHEWGAITVHQGSKTGETDVLTEDQSDLPQFVQVWSKQPVREIMMIMKPIIYFYTKEKMTARVQVSFPKGMLTQWYPQVTEFKPERIQNPRGGPRVEFKNGRLEWRDIVLDPKAEERLAKTDEDHPWWHIAREVDATTLQVNGAQEKFLFYRGAGEIELSVTVKTLDDGRLALRASEGLPVTGVFVVRVSQGKAKIDHLRTLDSKMKVEPFDRAVREDDLAAEHAAAQAQAQMTEALEVAGLFPKEAAGLMKIWRDDFFTRDGVRVLYLMPQKKADEILPLVITPEPAETRRVLIGWIECSTAATEERVRQLISMLGADDFKTREDAEAELIKIDRFAEAILRREMAKTKDAEVQLRIERILEALEAKRSRGTSQPADREGVRLEGIFKGG